MTREEWDKASGELKEGGPELLPSGIPPAILRDREQRAGGGPLDGWISVDTVQPERVSWLWPNRFPANKLSLLAGVQGLGKSLVSIDIAARITRGLPWPDLPSQTAPMGSVLFVCPEDGVADTIRPRLDAAGADCARVKVWSAGASFRDGVGIFKRAIAALQDVRLVVIDPITAYTGDGRDPNDESKVRPVLQALSDLAEKHDVAVLGLGHLSKSPKSFAIHRVFGSIAFTAVPRVTWFMNANRDNPDVVDLFKGKMNIGKAAPPAWFEIGSHTNGAGFVKWLDGVPSVDEDAMTGQERTRASRVGPKVEAAMNLLREWLKNGPVKSTTIDELAEKAGLSKSTIKRAKDELKIMPVYPDRPGSEWGMRLPDAA